MHDEIAANRRISEEKIKNNEYDVFISYDKADREHVITINRWLRDNGIASWRYEWDAQPGIPEQASIEEQIKNCKAAAVIIGEAGISPDQKLYISALQRALRRRTLSVIPVFLEKAPQLQELPILMEEMAPVDFRRRDPDPLTRLISGITGQHPAKVYRPGILVASLGESPVVVSSMLRLLTEKEKLTIDEVHVLVPNDDDVQLAYRQIKEALPGGAKIYPKMLDFKDADSWRSACSFLQELYRLLDHYEKQGETVYLSLAGGRKSIASLMAWVVPYFSCVRKLYHVIDKNEEQFVSSARLNTLSASKRTQVMNPDLDQLILVDIPFENRAKINNELLARLLSSLPDTYDEIEAYITERIIIQEKTAVKVEVTKRVVDQFAALRKANSEVAQVVRNTLLSLSNIETLRGYESIVEGYSHKVPKFGKRTFYSLTQGSVRLIFYTTPDDIFPSTEVHEVEKVIICSLETGTEHQTLKQIVTASDFSTSSHGSIDALPLVPSPAESVLIVPLGKMPMVATQLYTLLKEQEKRAIREVVLLYPALSVEINNAARIVKEALQTEDEVLCTLVGVPELDDITISDDCRKYQKRLEAEIKRVQTQYRECHIDLALSGGRKGMTAMTIFAAQMNNIPYVYHTLVTDDSLSEDIEEQTTVSALKKTGMSQRERNDRLFLRAYHSEDPNNPYEKFVLFRVPIFNEQTSGIAHAEDKTRE